MHTRMSGESSLLMSRDWATVDDHVSIEALCPFDRVQKPSANKCDLRSSRSFDVKQEREREQEVTPLSTNIFDCT